MVQLTFTISDTVLANLITRVSGIKFLIISGALSRRSSAYLPISPPTLPISTSANITHHHQQQQTIPTSQPTNLTLALPPRPQPKPPSDPGIYPTTRLLNHPGALVGPSSPGRLASAHLAGPSPVLPRTAGQFNSPFGRGPISMTPNVPSAIENRQHSVGNIPSLYAGPQHSGISRTLSNGDLPPVTAANNAQHHLNALAAAYNLPSYGHLRNPPVGLPANHPNSAVAIAYAHHQQLEAARRINHNLQPHLPPLIKPHHSSVPTSEKSNSERSEMIYNPTSEPLTVNTSPGAVKSNFSSENGQSSVETIDSSMDQENRHERESNPRQTATTTTSSDSSKKNACLSCHKDSLKCETCCVVFSDNVMYTIHLGLHSKVDPLKCNLCGFRAENRYDFASHIARGDHKISEHKDQSLSPVKTF